MSLKSVITNLLIHPFCHYCSTVLLLLCQSCSTANLILSATSFMPQLCVLRGHPEMSSFSRAYTTYAGRDSGGNVHRVVLMVYRDFEKGSQNQHFQNIVLVGRVSVTKKEYSVDALDNVDYRPLSRKRHCNRECG